MKKSIDSVSLEITKTLAEEKLSKALPPKLAYRFKKWLQMRRPKSLYDALALAEKELITAELSKSGVTASVFDSGHVKLEFSKNASEKVKRMALEWAKKKGLNITEASLAKSSDSSQSIMFGPNAPVGQLLKTVDIFE